MEEEAQCLWGSQGLRRGSSWQGGGGSALLPPTRTPLFGELPASAGSCPMSPTMVAAPGRRQTPSPRSDLCRACQPVNNAQPLVLIKISEKTLKRKPLGQRAGEAPGYPSRGKGTGHSSWIWKAAPAGQGTTSTLRTSPSEALGAIGRVGQKQTPASRGAQHAFPAEASGSRGKGRGREAGRAAAPAAWGQTSLQPPPQGPAGSQTPAGEASGGPL